MTGHPIVPLTNGFTGTARWLQLAPRAFDDLVHSGGLPGSEDVGFWSSTAVVLLLPDLEGIRFEHDPRSQPARIAETFVDPLRRLLPASLPAKNILVQALDRIGLASVVERFPAIITDMQVDRLVALAVDSYVCPFALNWLGETGRLKGDLNPIGLAAGEAAAAVLLEPSQRGDQRATIAHIIAVATGKDAPIGEGEVAPLRGRVLAEVLQPLLTNETADLYLDLNGEAWRAQEYGHALVGLVPKATGPSTLHCPAIAIGDTGASSFVVNTIVSARSLQRGYARGSQVAVATSQDTGEVAGLLLRSEQRS